jgi:5-amino-6-(5-phosphoribosylamino)uracil reductase
MKIITNTAISLDGKIATAHEPMHFMGSSADKKRLLEIRDLADAVLVGGNTFRAWPNARLSWSEAREPLLNVILTRGAELALPKEFVDEPRIEPLVFTSSKKLARSCPVEAVFCADEITPAWIVSELEKREVSVLLLEGGGDIIAQFLVADLIDEMYVTLCPKIIGGLQAPSLVGGLGFDQSHIKNLEIISQQLVGDEIFLHYRIL